MVEHSWVRAACKALGRGSQEKAAGDWSAISLKSGSNSYFKKAQLPVSFHGRAQLGEGGLQGLGRPWEGDHKKRLCRRLGPAKGRQHGFISMK